MELPLRIIYSSSSSSALLYFPLHCTYSIFYFREQVFFSTHSSSHLWLLSSSFLFATHEKCPHGCPPHGNLSAAPCSGCSCSWWQFLKSGEVRNNYNLRNPAKWHENTEKKNTNKTKNGKTANNATKRRCGIRYSNISEIATFS